MKKKGKKIGGRPPVAEAKNSLIKFRCSSAHKILIQELADQSVLSLSEYCLLASLRRRLTPPPRPVPSINESIAFEINKIGTNINQVVKKINSGLRGAPAQLHPHLVALTPILKKIAAGLQGEKYDISDT